MFFQIANLVGTPRTCAVAGAETQEIVKIVAQRERFLPCEFKVTRADEDDLLMFNDINFKRVYGKNTPCADDRAIRAYRSVDPSEMHVDPYATAL